jgi:hypothetical protein
MKDIPTPWKYCSEEWDAIHVIWNAVKRAHPGYQDYPDETELLVVTHDKNIYVYINRRSYAIYKITERDYLGNDAKILAYDPVNAPPHEKQKEQQNKLLLLTQTSKQ